MSTRLVAALVAALACAAAAADAQVAPDAHWRTLRTTHFRVHFTPELEQAGRRAAVDAERAYAALARRLTPPRGPIDLVIADNVDFSNGFTTVFPTNRIVVYAHPPLDIPSLRYYDDWLPLVITHELTHVFHLDRTRGWWRLAQHVFGRGPFLFPNQYDPAWVTEGLATFYESDVTGSGRVEGTFERMIVDASVQEHRFLPFDRWSLASTRYPGGEMAYGFGSLFFEYLARTRGREAIRDFVERSSGAFFPFRLNRAASHTFGISFSDAWREWRDTLAARRQPPHPPLAGWRDLSRGGHLAGYPRWLDSTSLVYAASDWTSSPGAYRASLAGTVERLGRRNGVGANAVLPDGSLLYAQLEFTDPYHIRSDLYVQRKGEEIRLTHGARLAQPDARADGAIVAVRFVPATTQLVRVSADGGTITPITPAVPDTQWAEPRWSPRGDRIAVTRWTRGGYADVVVLDTLGALVAELTHDRAFDSTPTWSPDGTQILFASDRTGTTELYIAPADGTGEPRRLSRALTGVFYPVASPDGDRIAAARYDAAGWHIGVAPFDTAGADSPPVIAAFDGEAPPLAPLALDTAAAHPYSPWGALIPRYWLPIAAQTPAGGYAVGALTSASDVVGRHAYVVQALYDPRDGEHTFDASYRYAGLGQPLISVAAFQDWDRQTVIDTDGTSVAGTLDRRRRTVSLGVTVSRPRVRTNAFAALAGEFEMRHYTTDPAPLIGRLADFYRSDPHYWSLVASVGWANAQRPPLAISLEDGLSVAAVGRLRWLDGGATNAVQSRSVSAALNAYKSLDLGGFAHHVVAARVAAGFANGADPGEFDVGGSNGVLVSILPGITTGAHHTFSVRGFPSGARSGPNAIAGTLEYRAPLGAPHRGLGFWPVFLDRASVSLFADAGTAWGSAITGPARNWIASAGAELNLDTALQYDVPYRLRVGLAAPIVNHSLVTPSAVSVYFQVGYQF